MNEDTPLNVFAIALAEKRIAELERRLKAAEDELELVIEERNNALHDRDRYANRLAIAHGDGGK